MVIVVLGGRTEVVCLGDLIGWGARLIEGKVGWGGVPSLADWLEDAPGLEYFGTGGEQAVIGVDGI